MHVTLYTPKRCIGSVRLVNGVAVPDIGAARMLEDVAVTRRSSVLTYADGERFLRALAAVWSRGWYLSAELVEDSGPF